MNTKQNIKIGLVALLMLGGCTSKLDAVNWKVNNVAYVSDQENYGVKDYWAKPELFYKNGGDCEDYVFAKYEKIKHFEDVKEIKFILAWLPDGQSHLVLRVDDKILDNMSKYIEDLEYLDKFTSHVEIEPHIYMDRLKG